MITSIVLNGMYNIGINGNNKMKVEDKVLHVENDIPFVRYRFESFGEAEIAYIKDMQTKFTKSTHLLEMHIANTTKEVYDYIRSQLKAALYLYIDLTEDIAKAGQLPQEQMDILESLQGCTFDRYMLKDKSDTLDYMEAKKIITQISKQFKIKDVNIGICDSPLSFKGLQCLTAVKARELMSLYNDASDVPLPSANHENMNCCGCIRYLEVNSDLAAPSEGKKAGSGEKKSGSENKTPKKKDTSLSYRPGMYSF